MRRLTYLNNRYYDPTTGNFVSVDPLVGKTGTPYLYAAGNPSTLSDPSGLDRCDNPSNPGKCNTFTGKGAGGGTGGGGGVGSTSTCLGCGAPGAGQLTPESGSQTETWEIPVWEGRGVTRVQLFIPELSVCLGGTVVESDSNCGQGDNRGFAGGSDPLAPALTNYNASNRVTIVFDHETGVATMVIYPTHNWDGSEVAASNVHRSGDAMAESGAANYITPNTPDGKYAGLSYRLGNSKAPSALAGLNPIVINGFIQMRPLAGGSTGVEIQGLRADFPNIEIIRDIPSGGGYTSTVVLQYQHEPGGVSNLLFCCSAYTAAG